MKTPLHLLCPKCTKPIEGSTCGGCGFIVEIKDRIVDLRVDPNFDTLLDIDAYEKSNKFVDINKKLGLLYTNFIATIGRNPGGVVLELASGSGNLTLSLLHSGHFDHVVASDISPDFLEILSRRYVRNPSDTRLDRFLFDANALPFSDNQFDFVMGNSVLHHFAHFEKTLAETARVLKSGGIAAFGEPILDTHAFCSLAAGIMMRWYDENPTELPDARTVQVLKSIQGKTVRKMQNLNSDRTGLAQIEDKFQFPVSYLRSIVRKCGFSEFHIDERQVPNLGSIVRREIASLIARHQGNAAVLDQFEFVFSAMDHDYGEPMAPYIRPFFNLFAFVK